MQQYISLPQLAGTAAGTVTCSQPLTGELYSVYVASNCAGTVQLTQSTAPAITLLNLTGGAGTAWYYPRFQGCDIGGTAIAGVYDPAHISGYLSCISNAAGTVNVTVAVETG